MTHFDEPQNMTMTIFTLFYNIFLFFSGFVLIWFVKYSGSLSGS